MKSKRRYLQFSLGTMFLAVTVLCIWLGVQVKWMRDRQEARKWLRDHACPFGIGYDPNDPFMDEGPAEVPAPWPIRVFGEDGVAYIEVNPESAPDVESTIAPIVQRMQKLFPEANVTVPLAPVMSP